MTRNDGDLLRANVIHHLNIGCERVLVVDNGSGDATPRILKRLARKYPVDWEVDRGEMRQPEIVTDLARRAFEQGAGWVIPLDTDEFWRPIRPLLEICAEAADSGIGALEVPRVEFVQARDQKRSTRKGHLRARMRVEQPILGPEAVAEFANKERSMFEIAPPPKLLMRTTPELTIDRGAHNATGLPGPIEFTHDLTIFHLAMRSRREALSRIEHGRRITRIDDNPNSSLQNRYWLEMSEEGRVDEAWRAHSYADGALDVNGRRVDLIKDDNLFALLDPLLVTRAETLRRKVDRRLRRWTGRPPAVR